MRRNTSTSITVSITKNVIGWPASLMVHCGTAINAQMHDIQKVIHASLFSLLGSFHADTNIGSEPREQTPKLTNMPATGLLVTIVIIPTTAPKRQNLSRLVHPASPYFKERTATDKPPAIAPRIWPLTDPAPYMPASVTQSRLTQIIQVALTGFVSPRKIALT